MGRKRWNLEELQRIRRNYRTGDIVRDVQGLVGEIEEGIRGPSNEILIHDEFERDEARTCVEAVFTLGCRVGEIIGQDKEEGAPGLRKKDINPNPRDENKIDFTIYVEKKYDKDRDVYRYKSLENKMKYDTKEEAEASGYEFKRYLGFTTKRKQRSRIITLPINETFVRDILEWRDSIDREKMFDIKYNRFYRIVRRAGELKEMITGVPTD